MVRLKKNHINLIIVCILLLTISAYSVQNAGTVDFFLMTGYGIPTGGYTDTNLCSQEFNSSSELLKEKNHYLNYGHGLQIETGLDYYFLKTLNIRASLFFTGGFPAIKVHYKRPNEEIDYIETYHRTMFGINLKLMPHMYINKLLTMYTGIGAGAYFAILKITNDDERDHPYKGYFKTNPALGLDGILGFDYLFSDRASAFLEFSFDQTSFSLIDRRNTDSSTEIHYEKNSTTFPAPRKIPGSNIGLRIGIKFALFQLQQDSEVY